MSTVHQESTELQWGRDYLMVEPNHFRVDYAINPFMDLNDQPEPLHTRAEWLAVVAAIEAAGGRVQVLPQLPDAPDMVYAMNLGLALESANDAGGDRPASGALAHAVRAASDGDACRRRLVRGQRLHLEGDRPRRCRRPLRGRRRVRLAR